MVVPIAVEHVTLDQLVAELGRPGREFLLRQREPRIAHEPLVVEQHGRNVVIAGDKPDHRLAVEPRLAEHRVVLAHASEDAVRVGLELGAVDLVLPNRDHAGMLLTARRLQQLRQRWTDVDDARGVVRRLELRKVG